MINLNFLRENPKKASELILKREPDFPVDRLISLDQKVRDLKREIDELRKERNDLASKAASGITEEIRKRSIEIGRLIKEKEKEEESIREEFEQLILACPNFLQEEVPPGNKESNLVIKEVGKKPQFNFQPKNHLELNEKLGWFDFKIAAQMTGANFVFYREDAVRLLYGLTLLMIRNNRKYGFTPVLPPFLVTKESLVNSGNLPKFEGDFYEVKEENLCLTPTAEVNLTNVYAGQILEEDDLPIRLTAWTNCFRREAGGYGASDRGLIRIHQFDKVEIYSICEPEDSNKEQELMLACAEDLLQQLGLAYRVSLLAAQDCSFSSSRTYDIEIWLPGQKQYYEVSSASNCTDFQARRAKIRFRKKEDGKKGKPQLVHTLNASSLALPRLMVALMETYQQSDGSILFPDKIQEILKFAW